LHLLPNEPEHVEYNQKLERRGPIATLPEQFLLHRLFHTLGAKQQDQLHLSTLRHQDQNDCKD
jgi:hypothetical protein